MKIRAVLAIGHDLVRQSSYVLVSYIAYAGLLTWIARTDPQRDILGMITTELGFILAISSFVASAAIPTEIRTRRVLFWLSKGISRAQYFAASVYGVFLLALAMAAASLGTWVWLSHQLSLPLVMSQLVLLTVAGITLDLLLIAAALLGVAMTQSRLATVVPAIVLLLPQLPSWLGFHAVRLPHIRLLEVIIDPLRKVQGSAIAWTLLEAAVLYAVALSIFERKDVTVAGE